MEQRRRVFLLGQGLIEERFDPIDQFGSQLERPPELQNGVLDGIDVDVGRIAVPLLASAAVEVQVRAASPSGDPREDHPVLPTSLMALTTPEAALQVVVMAALAH